MSVNSLVFHAVWHKWSWSHIHFLDINNRSIWHLSWIGSSRKWICNILNGYCHGPNITIFWNWVLAFRTQMCHGLVNLVKCIQMYDTLIISSTFVAGRLWNVQHNIVYTYDGYNRFRMSHLKFSCISLKVQTLYNTSGTFFRICIHNITA